MLLIRFLKWKNLRFLTYGSLFYWWIFKNKSVRGSWRILDDLITITIGTLLWHILVTFAYDQDERKSNRFLSLGNLSLVILGKSLLRLKCWRKEKLYIFKKWKISKLILFIGALDNNTKNITENSFTYTILVHILNNFLCKTYFQVISQCWF